MYGTGAERERWPEEKLGGITGFKMNVSDNGVIMDDVDLNMQVGDNVMPQMLG